MPHPICANQRRNYGYRVYSNHCARVQISRAHLQDNSKIKVTLSNDKPWHYMKITTALFCNFFII